MLQTLAVDEPAGPDGDALVGAPTPAADADTDDLAGAPAPAPFGMLDVDDGGALLVRTPVIGDKLLSPGGVAAAVCLPGGTGSVAQHGKHSRRHGATGCSSLPLAHGCR